MDDGLSMWKKDFRSVYRSLRTAVGPGNHFSCFCSCPWLKLKNPEDLYYIVDSITSKCFLLWLCDVVSRWQTLNHSNTLLYFIPSLHADIRDALFFSFIAILMSFCKKGLHSFLAFTNLSDINTTPPMQQKCHPGSLGIGLVNATGDTCRPPNVLESATVGAPPPPPFPSWRSGLGDGYGLRKETDGVLTVGFFEEVGEVVDGLMSCTESLGFESSDERRVDEGVRDMGNDGAGDSDLESRLLSRAKRREESERMRDRKFPPPITSLNDKGRPNFFLRAVRRDGRLELAEVRIDRPEILRASRADGRLRLEFVKEQEEVEVDAEADDDDAVEVSEEDQSEEMTTSESEEDVGSDDWKVLVSGEGRGRCHHVIGLDDRRHPHNLHVWRSHCVTIR